MNSILLAVVAAFSFGDMKVESPNQGDWKIEVAREVANDGAEIAKIKLSNDRASIPPQFSVSFSLNQVCMDYRWKLPGYHFGLTPGYEGKQYSEFAKSLPLYVFFDSAEMSGLSLAASECDRHVRFKGIVEEEGTMIDCKFDYFTQPDEPCASYETSLRIQRKVMPFADAVRDGVRWMEKSGGYKPVAAPESAFLPFYSTWYSFHVTVNDKDVESECEKAVALGMKGVILDSGWQLYRTLDAKDLSVRNWGLNKTTFPNMRSHVKKVQSMGLKYLVWFSAPFMYESSEDYVKMFSNKCFGKWITGKSICLLDPRFPEVREYLISTYEKALKEWGVDGFKIDFVDAFRWNESKEDPAIAENYAGRDIKSVPLAVKKLVSDIYARLTAIKPDILLEFRQDYVGPSIRQYGNILRVADCPGDMRRNRSAIADLRLIAGDTAVHADMLEWNFNETPEKVGHFIINTMFAAIQYSVMLKDAPLTHREMMKKWIAFSQEHRETLLKSKFTPHHAELGYPIIEAESDSERIIGVYLDSAVVDISDNKKTILMNATHKDKIVVRRNGKVFEVPCKSADWVIVP